MVIDEIVKLSIDRPYFDAMVSDMKDAPSNELVGYEDRLKDVERQLNRLLNLYPSGIIDLSEIQDRVSALKDERNKIQTEIEKYEVPAAMPVETAWNSILSLVTVPEDGNIDSVHKIIHSLIDKIVVLNYDVVIYWSFC